MENLTTEQVAKLAELKAIITEKGGFLALDKEQKLEYQGLIDMQKKGGNPPKVKGRPKLEKQEEVASPDLSAQVSALQQALDKTLSRLSELEGNKNRSLVEGKEDWESIETKNIVRTATLRVMGDKYLIDWKFDRKQWNERLREIEDIYSVGLLLPSGETEKAEITLSTMAKLQRKEITILDIDVQQLRKVVGKTRVMRYDYDSYGKDNRPGDLVDQEVRAVKRVFTVKLEDGRTLKLDEGRING